MSLKFEHIEHSFQIISAAPRLRPTLSVEQKSPKKGPHCLQDLQCILSKTVLSKVCALGHATLMICLYLPVASLRYAITFEIFDMTCHVHSSMGTGRNGIISLTITVASVALFHHSQAVQKSVWKPPVSPARRSSHSSPAWHSQIQKC